MSWIMTTIAVISLILAAWLRAAGSAISRIPRADAHHDAAEGMRGARMVAGLLDDRARILPSVGMVGSALLVVAAVIAGVAAEQRWTGWAVLGVVLATVLLGDVVPRLAGRAQPRLVAYHSGPLLAAAVRLGGWATERAVDENGNGSEDREEEDEEELALISSVLRFSETIVREVMVPRLDMVTIDVEADGEEMAAAAMEYGYSRFPVVEDEEVVGLLLVKDLLGAFAGGEGGVTARLVMRPAVFVPEVKQIADLLAEMRASKTHMAIVVDEFGEIAGLVTIEDLLEELVGEIADETDDEEIWVQPLSEGTWRVDARLAVEDLSDLLDLHFPDGDWDTVGGLVLGLAERVPEENEAFTVDAASLTVARMQGRRVAEVIVTAHPSAMARDAS